MRRVIGIACIVCVAACVRAEAADPPESPATEPPSRMRSYGGIVQALLDVPVPAPPMASTWNDITLAKFNEWSAASDRAIVEWTKGAKISGIATVTSFSVPRVAGADMRMRDADIIVVVFHVPIGTASFKGLPIQQTSMRCEANFDRSGPVAQRLAGLKLPAKCTFSGRIAHLGVWPHVVRKRPEGMNVAFKLEDGVDFTNLHALP